MNVHFGTHWRKATALAAGYAAWRLAIRYYRTIDFYGRVIAITGGSRGLGLVLARQFAAEGAKLAICARNQEELEAAQSELLDQGVPVLAQVCDLEDREQIKHFFNTVQRDYGRIDVLVNNAGVIQVGPMNTLTHADFEQAMNLHFWAAVHSVAEVLPIMRRQQAGRIVNVASIGGQIAVPHLLPYSASKFALVGFSDGLRSELRQEGIYVTTVCPGLMRTGSPRNASFKGQHRAEYAWFSIGSAMPLLSMSAERAASQILNACRHGRAKVTLSLPAKLGVLANTLAPELTADLMGLTNWLLPAAGGIGSSIAKGRESQSWVSPSILTTLTDRAAERNNEMVIQ
jgi:short-subunit dehydrogenase